MPVCQRQVVQPADRISIAVVVTQVVGVVRAGFVAVLAVASFDAAVPVCGRLGIGEQGDAAQLRAAVGIGSSGVVVEFSFGLLVEGTETNLHLVVQALARIQSQTVVAEGISVIVGAGHKGRGAVEARGLLTGRRQIETGVLIPVGSTQAALPRLVGAVAELDAGPPLASGGSAGKNLHDAANGIRAVEGGSWPAQYFHAFNLANIQQFKKRATAGDVRNALAIDQYHV